MKAVYVCYVSMTAGTGRAEQTLLQFWGRYSAPIVPLLVRT
jgi:hypothetical protein